MSRLCQFTITALLLVFCSISGALADDPLQFLYPDEDGLEFHYLDRIDVSYESNFSAPFLFTWCGQGNAQEAQQDRPDGGNATTQITLQFTSDGNLDCWFNLRIHDLGDSSSLSFNSPSFTYVYTTRKGGPATLGLPTATQTSVSTPTASSVITATVTSSSTPPPSGLSTGAKAGIGVGVAVGAIAIAAAAGAFIFRRRKRARSGLRRTDTRDVSGEASPGLYPELQGDQQAAELGGMGAFKGKYAPVAPESPQEMPADHNSPEIERHELPAGLDGMSEGNVRP
ncbi:hypothetical protein LA080_009810 [Diaporthe eres]|nr:hypothetical protein LA080_009810 [Diaporthe eres]